VSRSGGHGSGHTLGGNDPSPGADPPWQPSLDGVGVSGLDCVHCHAPHGDRRAYRNLRSDAGNNLPGEGLVTYNHESPGSLDLSRDVFVRRALDYDESAVDFTEPDPGDSAIARFCAGCHGEFHGRPGSRVVGGFDVGRGWVGFVRHPAAGVDIGAIGGEHSSLERFRAHASRVKVMSSTGSWDSPAPDVTPTCITCHKAHGNGNPFGLILRSGRGAPTEDGDTDGNELRDLCGQCHVQGSAFAEPLPQPQARPLS
jgi:cytochrome c553